ncbi:MAG: T9SS type A sorting domain-containing protein, partial [bacterium]
GSSSTPGVTFSWVASNGGNIVSGANTATPLVNAAGTYTLTVTNPANGCTANDVAVVTLNATLPNASAGADQVLTCSTTQINLSGSSSTPGVTFSWVASNGGNIVSGANTATPLVNAAGTYTLTVTNPANGCAANDVAVVTLNATLPNASAGADKALTCTTTQINLSGSSSTPGVTFSWVASNGGNIVSGANTATPLVNAAGTYTLTVTNPANGCAATDFAVVTLNATLPNVNAGADKVLTCTTTQINLSGSSTTPGATFSWVASNGGHIVSGANTATPLVDAAGTYTLTVTNPANGCAATDVAVVTRNATLPNVNAGADKVLTCSTTQITLSGSSSTPGVTFSWVASNGGHIVSGANTATPVVDAAGTYTLTVTNPANGCTAIDVAEVILNATPPNVSAGADQVLTCTTTQVTLSGSSSTLGATFSWVASNGGHIVSGANTATPVVDAAGTYTLTVTNPATGCAATDFAVVTRNVTPPNANAGADKVLTCITTQVTLSGSSSTPGATFSWAASNGGNIVSGANTASPVVDAAGTYTLTVTNPVNGCTANDVAIVTANNTPPTCTLAQPAVLPVCGSTGNILSAAAGFTNYAWSLDPAAITAGWNITGGQGTNTINYTAGSSGTATFSVTVTDANGCRGTCETSFSCTPDLCEAKYAYVLSDEDPEQLTRIRMDVTPHVKTVIVNHIIYRGSAVAGRPPLSGFQVGKPIGSDTEAMARNGNTGTTYIISNKGSVSALFKLNVHTGSAYSVGYTYTNTGAGVDDINSLAFNDETNELYGITVNGDRLLKIDTTTARVTMYASPITTMDVDLEGASFDHSVSPAQLYVISEGSDGEIFRVNTSTGRGLLVGDTIEGMETIEFTKDGRLFAANHEGSIYEINRTTYVATLFALIPELDGEGLVFDECASVFSISVTSLDEQSEAMPSGEAAPVPTEFALHQNYPNPFNPVTRLQFDLPQAGAVRIAIYDMVGHLVRTLATGEYAAGQHHITWDATDERGMKVGTGIYFCRFESNHFVAVRKMLLAK